VQKNRTKIVCTIGPASWDPDIMREMIESGMDCARVNCAFADTDELDKVKRLVNDVSNDVSLMIDVKGPEIRLNKFPEPIKLEIGKEIVVGNGSNTYVYPGNYNNVYKFLSVGQRVVIGDGDVEFIVTKIIDDKMYWKVVYGEYLKPGKAMNLPGCTITSEVLTAKDKENLQHAINTGWDFVSASFIQNAESAKLIKTFMGDSKMKLIAKIEDANGIKNIDEILDIVDGVMIARGGLDVEMGFEKVPMSERLLIEKCKAAGKPVITATQMLESMTNSPRPTRAEVNDVATAIILGTDAVMLSGESSAGKYPVLSVKTLSKIADEINQTLEPRIIEDIPKSASPTIDALTKAAATLCIKLENDISKVVIVTQKGVTARLISRHGIKQPIHVYISEEAYRKQVLLTNNVLSATVLSKCEDSRDHAIELLRKNILKDGIAKEGEKVLILARTPNDGTEYFPNLFEIVEI
jgi:pyruvate kinase